MARRLKDITVLRKMRELLSDPKRWTKGADARRTKRSRNESGLSALDKDATCWCLLGAASKCTGGVEDGYGLVALNTAILETHIGHGIISFNDSKRTRHSHVLKVLDRAIEIETQRVRA
ncbi:MAG: hypothetical protein AB7R40_23215 [Nitrospiraceae bacterium]